MSTTRRSLLASLGASLGLALPALPLLAAEARAATRKPRKKKGAVASHKKPKARKTVGAARS